MKQPGIGRLADFATPSTLSPACMADSANELPDCDAPSAEGLLIERARGGDERAFGDLMQLHHEKVFRRVVAIVRNEEDARDLCQEIWLTVWKQLASFRGDARFSTWLFPLATRRAIDHLRRRRRWFDRFLPFARSDLENDSLVETEVPEPGPGPREHATQREHRERIEKAMASLPPMPRAVLALREIEGLSYAEIATTLDCPVGTVMSRLHQARRLLLHELKDLTCD